MAVPTNTFQRVSQVGVREALEDNIYDVSPEDHLCATAIGTKKTDNTYYEWQTDALRASDATNAMVDGDDFPNNPVTPTKRLGNHCQAFKDQVRVSGRASAANAAGRKEELSYQIERRMQAMKKDVEKRLLSNLAAVAPTTSVAGQFASFGACIATNANHNGAGATPAWNSGAQTVAPTAGTPRAFTEAVLKTAIKNAYVNGATMKMLFMSPSQKQAASAFTGIAQLRKDTPAKAAATIIGAADYYVSDFGDIAFVADRECDPNTVFGIDPEYASLRVYRAMFKKKLASNGDYDGYGLIHDVTLQVNNEAAHFKIADLS